MNSSIPTGLKDRAGEEITLLRCRQYPNRACRAKATGSCLTCLTSDHNPQHCEIAAVANAEMRKFDDVMAELRAGRFDTQEGSRGG